MSTKAGELHKWQEGYQPRGMAPSCPLVVILVTSLPEHPRPWFVVAKPEAGLRKEFVNDMVAMFFGCQPSGAPHTWEEAGTLEFGRVHFRATRFSETAEDGQKD